MERELWPRLYHLIMEVGQTLRLIDVSFQPHIIVLGTDQGFGVSLEHEDGDTSPDFSPIIWNRFDFFIISVKCIDIYTQYERQPDDDRV